nr:M23 family metallopeptidase [Actinomycetota bacterium]
MRTRSLLASALIAALFGPAGQADATAAPWLAPPLDSTISRYFQAPAGEWGSGHRGIDYVVMPGAQVRAAAPGIVTFAGPVAGVLAVTIDHTDGLETTYSQLSEI